MRKLEPISKLARRLAAARRSGKRIVFTNGCFDLLHIGHVRYLQRARALGDLLVVGLNSDASLRKIKGTGRPLSPERDRAEVIAGLACVDFVLIFNESDPYQVIRKLRPDVLVKGSDWTKTKIIGRDLVESWGGRVVRMPLVPGISTTALIRKIAGNR